MVFEGVKGRHASKGGLSLDDINLSETQCPHHTWRIRDFSNLLDTTPVGSQIFSPPFVSREGYSFQVSLYINGKKDSPDKMAIYFHLTSGPYDEHLKWPCPWRQASMEIMDQTPDIQKRMNSLRMVTTDPTKTSTDCKIKNMEIFNADTLVASLWFHKQYFLLVQLKVKWNITGTTHGKLEVWSLTQMAIHTTGGRVMAPPISSHMNTSRAEALLKQMMYSFSYPLKVCIFNPHLQSTYKKK